MVVFLTCLHFYGLFICFSCVVKCIVLLERQKTDVSRERCATGRLAAGLLRNKNAVKTGCWAILNAFLRGMRILRGKTQYARHLF